MWWNNLNTLNNTKKISDVVGEPEIIFPAEEKEYITKRSTEGWTPDVIIGRARANLLLFSKYPLSPV
jgi:hypothetical protein